MTPQRFELNTIYSASSHIIGPYTYSPEIGRSGLVRESSYFLWNGDYVNNSIDMFFLSSLADGVILSGERI